MMMKLMMATALVTATLVGSFMESAQAGTGTVVGEGNEATGSRRNEVDVNYNFKLFTRNPNGQLIEDEDARNNVGKFTGAIKEFKGKIGDETQHNLFKFDRVNLPNQFTQNPLMLDLTAKFIYEGESFSVANGFQPETFIDEFDDQASGKTKGWTDDLKALRDRIEYTLTGSALENEGISELTLIIDDLAGIRDPLKSVNSIQEIIDQQLLGKVSKIRVSGKYAKDENVIVSSERNVELGNDPDFPRPTVKTIPESSTNKGLITLGALGIGLLLKRQMKEI